MEIMMKFIRPQMIVSNFQIKQYQKYILIQYFDKNLITNYNSPQKSFLTLKLRSGLFDQIQYLKSNFIKVQTLNVFLQNKGKIVRLFEYYKHSTQKFQLQILDLQSELGDNLTRLHNITTLNIQVNQFKICNDTIEKQIRKYQIECIQLTVSKNFTKCEINYYNLTSELNLVNVNCLCESLGDSFLVYLEKVQEQTVEQVVNVFNKNKQDFDISNPYLLSQFGYFIFALIMSLILHKRDQNSTQVNKNEILETATQQIDINKQNLIYPGHYQIILQNYKYLHNILCLIQQQLELIRRPFNFFELAIQINFSFLFAIYLIGISPNMILPLRIFLQVIAYLIQKAFIKIIKGILRLNKMLQWLSIFFPSFQMISLTIIVTQITENFNGEIDAILSTSLSFIIYEIIFEPILIVSRVHVYSIAIPQIRIKQFNKIVLMLYFFAWHWRLEEVIKQYKII